LIRIDADSGSERGLKEPRIGRGDAVPAEGVEERGELAGWIKSLPPDAFPRFLADDAAIEFKIPVDAELFALSIVVKAC
jgi:hypothetical protein